MDLNQFLEWQKGRPERVVKIELRGKSSIVWVYDSTLDTGQCVTSASEIDLEKIKAQKDLEELARLQKKYGREEHGNGHAAI